METTILGSGFNKGLVFKAPEPLHPSLYPINPIPLMLYSQLPFHALFSFHLILHVGKSNNT